MKRLTDIFLLLCLVLAAVSCKNSGEERSHVLKVYNWADYIDEDVLAEFPAWYKQQTGEDIRLIYQVFDINEIMLTKIERGHEDFDVVCPSEYIIERMLKKDLLLPIDRNFGKTPDYLPNISPYIRRELNKTSQPGRTTTDYAVPYMWGTAGILYNRNFITPDEAGSWHCLWNSKNKGKILMKDSYRDAYGTAIIYAHARQLADSTVTVEQLMNDNSPEAIALAEKYLKAMKPNIAGWEADFGKEMMTKNKTWLNLTWSGDAVWAIEEAEAVGVDLAYEVPREGSNIWYDGWVIPKYAGNPKAAAYFINYLCRPDIALRNMDAIGYVSAVATPEIMEAKQDTAIATRSDLSYFFGEGVGADSLQINPVQYPDRKVVERCAMIRDFGNRTELVLEMWSRVKGDNLNTGIVLLIFSVFGVLFVWLVYGKIRKYRQKQRRHRRRRRR
jgi:spermidine/putrescine transport system substrate-binding protein